MDLNLEIFELLYRYSFSSVWFWIVVAVYWSVMSHWVIGVPYDMVFSARRHGGEDQADFEALTHISARRINRMIERGGTALTAFASFILSGLATAGFWYGHEFSQAVFLLFFPTFIIGLFSVRTAGKIHERQLTGEDLFRAMRLQRVVNQGIGMLAIMGTAGWWTYRIFLYGINAF